ncbi:MAG TPA: hydroxymethylbilane synthase [Actinocrinis sp.]|nr:hydroxymethylbilane synthase [Actinocrinis sp.]
MNAAPLRLGTRRSALALAQSGMVARSITRAAGRPVDLVEISTYGDVSREALAQIGGTGVFVGALRDALLDGRIDLAVHSLKDLPTAAPADLVLAAVPEREDARDVLVARDGLKFADLPPGARVGTGSPRRAAQLRLLREDLEILAVRGNVDTRIGFVAAGEMDAVVLAYAGLNRLARIGEATDYFDPAALVPAPGQGALAVECRAADTALAGQLAALDHAPTRAAVLAERALLAALEAGCSAPVGGYATVAEEVLHLTGIVADAAGPRSIRMSTTGPLDQAGRLGHDLAARLLARGAAGFMGK